MAKTFTTLSLALLFSAGAAMAQEDSVTTESSVTNNETTASAAPAQPDLQSKVDDLTGKINGLEESYLETKGTVEKLSKIKISGYLQAQVRYAPDTAGQLNADYTNKYDIGEFQGGKLPAATESVLQLRRVRIKAAYETKLSQMVVQLDALPFTTSAAINSTTQDTSGKYTVKTKNGYYLGGGGVTVKDAYLRFTEPWLKSIAFKAGIYDRPFGHEISYSSSSRESPERSRIFQTLFPGERDMGFSFEYNAADNMPLWAQYFNFKGGMFAGNGINIEFDDVRDVIGRLGFSVPLTAINLSIDGGVSGYVGNMRDRSDSLYETKNNGWVGTKGHKWEDVGRQYTGGDLELYYGDIPVLGGICLKGEFITGHQPGTAGSSVSQKSDQASKDALYLREISGYYGMMVLNIDPLKSQLVGKYDFFDPNTGLAGNDVKNATDLAYSTIGGGLVYHWDENVKMIAYYDKVQNETTTAKAPFDKDLNDDVFTFRIQYKF